MTAQKTPYRPEIDGLRAISILLVVAYHAIPSLVPGGFIGVDVFFVISGFLITKIISGEIAIGLFSVASFYARRVRRIFPALITVLAATAAVGWFVLLPDQFELFGKNLIASVLFANNLFQLTQAGYFAAAAADNPLLHLWSLGIEEQFYIFWPLVLLLIAHAPRSRLWIGLLAAASFCASFTLFFGLKDWAFYSPVARAWELLVGCLLADVELSKQRASALANIFSTTGLIALVASALLLNSDSPFSGGYAILPVLGAALILASPNSSINRRLLSAPLLVWIGLISYPLYLWHWPLLSYLGILRNGVPNFLEIWLAVIVAVILSVITYRLVELPLRHATRVVPMLSCSMVIIGATGVAVTFSAGFQFRFPAELQAIASLRTEDNPASHDYCFLESAGSDFDASCIEGGDKPLLLLWGDSTAAMLYPGLKLAEASTHSFRLARFGVPGCAPILDNGKNSRCDDVHRKAFGFIASSHPDVVLLHAMWGHSNNLDKLRATIDELRKIGVSRIVLLGPVPVWKRTLPHALINGYRFLHRLPDRLRIGISGRDEDELMESFSKMVAVQYISAWRVLCDRDGACLTRVGPSASDVIATDMVHLSERGAIYLVNAINDDLFPVARAAERVAPSN